jgi:hypothetical protein
MKGRMKRWSGILFVVCLVFVPSFSWADDDAYLLKKGTKEFTIGSGFARSFDSNLSLDMVPLDLRYGVILTDPIGPSILKGNFEVLGEATYDYIVDQGRYGIGLSALFRYNFLISDCFKPFFQLGIGVYNTNLAMRDFPNDFNFLSQAGVGFNLFISPKVALQLEYGAQHLSNASFYKHNGGLNRQKGEFGIAFFFK